jgi:hypothetical protein
MLRREVDVTSVHDAHLERVEDEKVMVEEANCYLLKVTAIKASLT